jgi:hypothetical protein
MDSAVNSPVHKLFKAKDLLFFISEMTLALKTVCRGRGTHYNNKKRKTYVCVVHSAPMEMETAQRK